jgi:hypothetical protein
MIEIKVIEEVIETLLTKDKIAEVRLSLWLDWY